MIQRDSAAASGPEEEPSPPQPLPSPGQQVDGTGPEADPAHRDALAEEGEGTSHSPWEPARHSEPEDDRALARMLGWAFLVGLGLWIVLVVALIGGAGG